MRDCKNCIHRTKNGCDSWDCEFEKRMPNEEAIKVLEMVEAYGIADRAKRTAIRALKNEQTDEDTDGDLVSRESVITMLQKICNAVDDGEGFQFNEWVEYAKDIPSAEKTTINHEKITITDTDLISRQAALDIFGDIHPLDYNARAYVTQIKELPSAEKIAVFKIVGNTTQHYECSKCNEDVDGWDKYCKHCGARLVL